MEYDCWIERGLCWRTSIRLFRPDICYLFWLITVIVMLGFSTALDMFLKQVKTLIFKLNLLK